MTAKPDPIHESGDPLVEVAILDDDADFRQYVEDLLLDEGKYKVYSYSHPEQLFAAAGNAPRASSCST